MLQTSQIEKPRCSATIDQMRLRRATACPLDFQYVSFSGSQSEIHVDDLLLKNLVMVLSCFRVTPVAAARLAFPHRLPPYRSAQQKTAAPRRARRVSLGQRRCFIGPPLDRKRFAALL